MYDKLSRLISTYKMQKYISYNSGKFIPLKIMLHATAHHGKSTLYRRYLHHRDGEEKHVHEEDEITSTVIGPLDFLQPAEVHQFWHQVLASDLLLESPPTSARLLLWDSRHRIEPDARVDLKWSNGNRIILLIEIKWRAPLSGENQLHRQWQKYLTEDERNDALHVFIAPQISEGLAAEQHEDVWSGRLILLTWMQIRNALESLEKTPNGLGRWAVVANRFLKRIGVQRFAGFARMDLKEVHHLTEISTSIFWKPFIGFSDTTSHLPKLPMNLPSTLFFKIPR